MTVNDPPGSGAYAGSSNAVEVIVAQNVPLYFASVLGINSTTVRARAVSLLGNSPNCIYALNPSQPKALSANGAVNINLACGAYADSTDSNAMYLNGAVNWNGPSNVVGGFAEKGGSATINPAPNTGVQPQSDPLAYLAAPAYGACDYTNFKLSGSGNTTINPGVYCGGINLVGSGTVTLNPGLYVLNGGGLSVGGSTTITGTGVTFYNTGSTGHKYGGITITGSDNSSLTAPTTGALAGILFFQDRTIANPDASSITGTSGEAFVGALYFPTSALTFSGTSNGQYTILVADTVSFSGSAKVDSNYTSLPAGSPVKNVVLGE